MELYGILCSLPAAFLASAIYSIVLRWLLMRQPWVKAAVIRLSLLVLGALVIEWGLLAFLGAVRTRAVIGPAFYPLHSVVFFLSVPALASLLVTKKQEQLLGSWFVVGLLCACLALPVVLTQYVVSEALYGIDGTGGPYGSQ